MSKSSSQRIPYVLSGLSREEVLYLQTKFPDTLLWDGYRARVQALDSFDEHEMVMSLYQIIFEQESRATWINGIITYSWVDAALFLEDHHPSYVDNFVVTFQNRCSYWKYQGFYHDEAECMRLHRVFPGIPSMPKSELEHTVMNLVSS